VSASNESGFTIVELTVSVGVLAIIGVAFLGLVASFFVTITRTNELSAMTITSQNLLRSTVENIRFGNGVEQTNTITDANAPAGGWNTSNSNFVIIIPVPAVDSSHNYIISTDTAAPYMNELVYYKNGASLMERRLANPNAAGNIMKTTCPANKATTSCPADIALADYVNTMTFNLYDQDGSTTTTPSLAHSIAITLNMQRNAPGNPLNLTTSERVTLRNRF
jgi:hypothetical protein